MSEKLRDFRLSTEGLFLFAENSGAEMVFEEYVTS